MIASARSVPATSHAIRLAVAARAAERGREADVDEVHRACRVRSPTLNVSAPPSASVSISSMPSRSMSIAPTSRRRRTPRPSRVSVERARRRRCRGRTASRARRGPSTWSFAVSGLPARAVVVAAEVDEVVALVRRHVVELVAAAQHVVAGAADDDVAAVAAVERQPDPARRQRRPAQLVVAAPAVEPQRVAGAGVVDLDEDRQPDHGHRAAGERGQVDEVAVRRARQARLRRRPRAAPAAS